MSWRICHSTLKEKHRKTEPSRNVPQQGKCIVDREQWAVISVACEQQLYNDCKFLAENAPGQTSSTRCAKTPFPTTPSDPCLFSLLTLSENLDENSET